MFLVVAFNRLQFTVNVNSVFAKMVQGGKQRLLGDSLCNGLISDVG